MTDRERSETASRLINRLGLTYAGILCVYFLSSPFLAAVAPFNSSGWRAGAEGLGRLLVKLSLPDPLLASLRGEGVLNSPFAFGLSYGTLVVAATAVWLIALRAIQKYRDVIDDTLADLIFRWSMIFTALLVFATPVLVHDFWLSVAWGRVLADGSNPYYVHPASTSDLPIRIDPGLMTYGPVWALISGATAFLAKGSALGTAALQKICIAAGWAGVVATVRALTREQPAATRCTALVMVAWAPLGLLHGVADGHNDVLLILPMLLWLLWLERGKPFASALALAVSISIKYVTAPLLVIHLARGLRRQSGDARPWLTSAFASVAAVLLFVAAFYRSPSFFAAAGEMQKWKFFTPAAILDGVLRHAGIESAWLNPAFAFLFIAVATVFVARWLRSDSESALRAASLWTMLGVTVGAVGHVWPWFLLWVLGLAAIQPARRIAWFVIGMTAAAPFIMLPWTLSPELNAVARFGVPGVLLYASGTVGFLAAPRAMRYLR